MHELVYRKENSMKKAMRCRSRFLGIVPMVFLFLLTGIEPSLGSGRTRTITDMTGRKVEVSDPLTRVGLLGGPTGQIAYILGARNQLCAITRTLKGSELILAMDPSIQDLPAPRSTSGHVNVEELIVSQPQLVVAGSLDGSIVEKKTKIPVAYFESNMNQSVDLLKKEIRFYGEVFGKHERAEKYVTYLEKTLHFLQSRTKDILAGERKSVFHGYSHSHLVTLGGDTFMHYRIRIAGCLNASEVLATSGAKEGLHVGLAEVSMERVLGWDPDIVVIDTGEPDDLYDDPRWKNIKAVKNRRVFKQPVGVFIWDRPTAEAAVLHPLWLAKIAYPERFKDLNMAKEVKRFYREIMSFDLPDSLVESLLAGKLNVNFGVMPDRR